LGRFFGDIDAEQFDFAFIWGQFTSDQIEQGRLSSPIRPDQSTPFTNRYDKVCRAHCVNAAKALGYPANGEGALLIGHIHDGFPTSNQI
jgi:hypothetical protein